MVQRERYTSLTCSPRHALLTFQMGITVMHYLTAEIEKCKTGFFLFFFGVIQTDYDKRLAKQ